MAFFSLQNTEKKHFSLGCLKKKTPISILMQEGGIPIFFPKVFSRKVFFLPTKLYFVFECSMDEVFQLDYEGNVEEILVSAGQLERIWCRVDRNNSGFLDEKEVESMIR